MYIGVKSEIGESQGEIFVNIVYVNVLDIYTKRKKISQSTQNVFFQTCSHRIIICMCKGGNELIRTIRSNISRKDIVNSKSKEYIVLFVWLISLSRCYAYWLNDMFVTACSCTKYLTVKSAMIHFFPPRKIV